MGVEGSAAINHRTGFSAFLLVKGQARKRAQAASELIKARQPWTSGRRALSAPITVCGLGGLASAATAGLRELPPQSAGHHMSVTPILRVRTGRQDRFKSWGKVTRASSQEHGSPDAPTYPRRSPPPMTETTALQPGPASHRLGAGAETHPCAC